MKSAMWFKINVFIVSVETVMGMSHFSYIGLPQMEPTFITDEIFITPGSGCNKHLKIKGTRKLLFQNNRLYFQNKSKSSLNLRRFYATWPLTQTLGFKCYYLWELYHAWVLVIRLVLSTDVARSTMGLVWINKIWVKTKTIQVKLLLYQSAHVCIGVYYGTVSNAFERPKNISMVYSLSSIVFEAFAYNVMPTYL